MSNSKLLSEIVTLQEKNALLQAIDLLIRSQFKNNEELRKNLEKLLPPNLLEIIWGELRSSLSEHAEQNQKNLTTLRDAIRTLPVIKCTLAIPPTPTLVAKIHNYLVQIGSTSIIDYSFDESLVGGVLIENNGKLIDYTLKTFIEQHPISMQT